MVSFTSFITFSAIAATIVSATPAPVANPSIDSLPIVARSASVCDQNQQGVQFCCEPGANLVQLVGCTLTGALGGCSKKSICCPISSNAVSNGGLLGNIGINALNCVSIL